MARQKTVPDSDSQPAPSVSDSHPRGEIVLVPNRSWVLDTSTPANMWPTNLDPDTPRGRSLIGAATQVADYQLDQQGRAEIVATHWLVFPGESMDEQTGEVDEVIWVALFDREGRFFKSTSLFARQAIRAAAALYKPHEWAAGIRFVVTSRLTSNKRVAHDVRIAFDDQ